MTLKTFTKKWLGKRAGDGQCVALVRKFIAQLEVDTQESRFGRPWGFNTCARVKAAKDFATAANPKYWTNHSKPWPEDIAVYGPTPGNRYGHVAIVLDTGPTKGTVRTLDQNWSRPGRTAIEAHRTSDAICYLRYKTGAVR